MTKSLASSVLAIDFCLCCSFCNFVRTLCPEHLVTDNFPKQQVGQPSYQCYSGQENPVHEAPGPSQLAQLLRSSS